MTEPKIKEDYSELGPELAKFYSALGKFNANKITTVTRDPTQIEKVTDGIIHCTDHNHDCPLGYEWDDMLMRCVKMAAELP